MFNECNLFPFIIPLHQGGIRNPSELSYQMVAVTHSKEGSFGWMGRWMDELTTEKINEKRLDSKNTDTYD